MTYDEAFEIDFRPAVPATVRNELNKHLRGTTRIVVYELMAEGRTSKINALRLTNKVGAFPKEPLEEIAEGVTAIMQVAWESQTTEDPDIGTPPMEFTVVCEEAGRGRKRTQFTYVYKGPDEPDIAEDTMGVEERGIMRILELYERAVNQREATISDCHERLLRIVEQNSSQAAAGATMMAHAVPMFMAANQQVLNAKTMEYSAAKIEAKEKATTERMSKGLEFLAPFFGLGVQQFLAAKFGIRMPTVDAEEGPANGANGHANGRARGPTVTQEGGHGDGGAAAGAQAGSEEEPPEHVLAAMADYFGSQLTNRQRAELTKILTKKQAACFDALFCATTDAEAYAGYQGIVSNAMDKLGALQALLDKEQAETLQAFMQGANQYAQRHPAQ